jgi:release factor glutamine methyltransferase
MALKNRLLKDIAPGQKVLEIGTGPHAILSIFLAKHLNCDITATDIDKTYVICAQETARINGITTINIVQSDLFENIENKFDIIFWNSVYIPKITGLNLGIDLIHEKETDWCGGDTGTEKIRKLLESAQHHLNINGKILLGFNKMYLPEKSIAILCKSYGYKVDNIHRGYLNPSLVAVVRPFKSDGTF